METRILVIEDNPLSLLLMDYLLQAFGYTPVLAESGEEGLEAARRAVPDMILCDIQLPGIDGYEVARQLKLHPVLGTIPLVAVTALAMVGDHDKVMASGFDGYVSKPIEPETFVNQVEVFLTSERRKCPPSADQEEARTTPPKSPPKQGAILIVDDSPANLAVLSRVLELSGYTVIAADNLEEGFQFAIQYLPDLILMNVPLRNESGFDLLEWVKADSRLHSTPFVFLSSTVWREQDRSAALTLGAADFLSRPIEPTVLLAAIAALLSERRTGNEAQSLGATPRGTGPSEDNSIVLRRRCHHGPDPDRR
jgi:CheY-like chemotaxis protein